MITVERGKDTTKIELEGQLGTIMLESISLISAIRYHVIDNIENSEEVIFHYVNDLIDAAYGK